MKRILRNTTSARLVSHRTLMRYLELYNLIMIQESDNSHIYNIVTADYATQVATVEYI